MTANHTARLQLMSPVDSDIFASSDFSDTFTKLDNAPGITVVPNYAALTALPWTTAQAGLMAYQIDSGNNTTGNVPNLPGILWFWTGTAWVRPSGLGVISRTGFPGAQQSASTSGNGIMVIASPSCLHPGGRSININVQLSGFNNVGDNGLIYVQVLDNGALLKGVSFLSGKEVVTDGNSHNLDIYIPAASSTGGTVVTPQTTHVYQVWVRAVPGSGSLGAGGTAVAGQAVITVTEL